MVETVDWRKPTLFPYVQANGNWHKPAFQLKIKNTGHRQLTVSLLYLGENFSITNQLIQAQILEPDQEVWALDHADGRTYITIPLQLEDHYLQAGIETIPEFFKVIVCTEPFDTDRFNQSGIPWRVPSAAGVTRALAGRGQIEKPDWQYFEIPILIQKPKNAI